MATKTKADAHGPFREFDFAEWLRDGVKEACNRLERETPSFEFSEFRTHLRKAQKERLLAVRSLLDKAIERLDSEEKTKA